MKFIDLIREKQAAQETEYQELLTRDTKVKEFVEKMKGSIDEFTNDAANFNIHNVTFYIERGSHDDRFGEREAKVFRHGTEGKTLFEGPLRMVKAAYDLMTDEEGFSGSCSLGIDGHMTFRW